MKVLPFKIPKADNRFFRYQMDTGKNFYDKFHQHEEIQISLIVNGSGTLVAGDSVQNYSTDDIFIFGSRLPHLFIDDEKKGNIIMVSLFFNLTVTEPNIFSIEELKKLKYFLVNSACGFKLENNQKKVKELLLKMKNLTRIRSFISFLNLLDILRLSRKTQLSREFNHSNYTNLQGERMQKVINYTLSNYREKVSLNAIAEIANLSPNAFCKYFKKHTNKPYFTFVNELRTNYASNLLVSDPEKPIVEIAEGSGFNNLSNFNRQFKKHTGLTPKQHRADV